MLTDRCNDAIQATQYRTRAEPYKINLYDATDYFREHVDTPATNLTGTVLVSLSELARQEMGSEGITIGGLCIKFADKSKYSWRPQGAGEFVGFFADLRHCVNECGSSSKSVSADQVSRFGVRTTLAFKIFADPVLSPGQRRRQSCRTCIVC